MGPVDAPESRFGRYQGDGTVQHQVFWNVLEYTRTIPRLQRTGRVHTWTFDPLQDDGTFLPPRSPLRRHAGWT